MARDCGTCSACCRWPEIPELKKPRGVPCSHLEGCGYGCTVYQQRPRSCSTYRCSWIEGYGGGGDRPDDCGVLIDRRSTDFGVVLVARDLGGPPRPKKKAIKRIARDLGLPCILVDGDNPDKIVGLRGPVGAVRDYVALRPEMGSYA